MSDPHPPPRGGAQPQVAVSLSIEDRDRMTQLVLSTGEENQRAKDKGSNGVSEMYMEGDRGRGERVA